MTIQEFWHLKFGMVVEYPSAMAGWGWRGTVVEREICNEICGFVITSRETHDILTGRKYLEITFNIGNGYKKYVQSNRPDIVNDLVIVQSD